MGAKYSDVGGGVSGYDANLDVGKYFVDVNSIRVRLVNIFQKKGQLVQLLNIGGGCTY